MEKNFPRLSTKGERGREKSGRKKDNKAARPRSENLPLHPQNGRFGDNKSQRLAPFSAVGGGEGGIKTLQRGEATTIRKRGGARKKKATLRGSETISKRAVMIVFGTGKNSVPVREECCKSQNGDVRHPQLTHRMHLRRGGGRPRCADVEKGSKPLKSPKEKGNPIFIKSILIFRDKTCRVK